MCVVVTQSLGIIAHKTTLSLAILACMHWQVARCCENLMRLRLLRGWVGGSNLGVSVTTGIRDGCLYSLANDALTVAAILWGSWGADPLTFWQCGGPSVHGPPTF